MEKIKVCEIGTKIIRGGVESYIFSYCLQPTDRYEFTFIFYENSNFDLPAEFTKFGAKVIYIPNIKHYFKYKKALKNVFENNNFDIVHSHLNTLSGFPLKIAKKYNIPIRISHSHSMSNKKEFLRNILKTIFKRSSRIYATNYFGITKEAAMYQFGKKRIDQCKIVPPFVNLQKFSFNELEREKIRKQFGYSKNDFVLGNVGRLSSVKNQSFLIDIIHSLVKVFPKYKLLIIGSGELEEKLNKKIKKYKLENNIKIIGSVSNIYDYYNAFDLFVFPSLYEGYGLVIPESQANGLSFIASNKIPTKSFSNYDGLFLPLKKKEWINEILKSQGRIKENFALVDENISNKNALFEVYEKLISGQLKK